MVTGSYDEKLVVGLHRHDQREPVLLPALHGHLRLGLGRIGRDDVLLVDGERDQRLDGLRLHDGVQVLDAHLLLGHLGDRLVLFGAQAHLLGEPDLRLLQRAVHFVNGRHGVELDLAVAELLLSHFHVVCVSFVRTSC